MEIALDEDKLQEAINSKMNEAVERALSDYSIQKVIAERITESFAYGVIGEALDTALKNIDVTALHQALSREIARATTRAAVRCLTDGLVETLLNLKNIPDYNREERAKARMELEAALNGKP